MDQSCCLREASHLVSRYIFHIQPGTNGGPCQENLDWLVKTEHAPKKNWAEPALNCHQHIICFASKLNNCHKCWQEKSHIFTWLLKGNQQNRRNILMILFVSAFTLTGSRPGPGEQQSASQDDCGSDQFNRRLHKCVDQGQVGLELEWGGSWGTSSGSAACFPHGSSHSWVHSKETENSCKRLLPEWTWLSAGQSIFGRCDWLKSTAVGRKGFTMIGRRNGIILEEFLSAECSDLGDRPGIASKERARF